MKRICAFVLTAALVLSAPLALAAGNATIAVRGRDGFDDYVSSLFVWDGRLLMSSYSTLFTWSREGGLAEVGSLDDQQRVEIVEEDGERYALLGEEEFDLEEEEHIYFTDSILAAGDRLFKHAILSGEEGVEATMFVEMEITEDGAATMGAVIDLGDALLEDWGDGYTGYSDLTTPCYADGVIYGMVWSMNGRELLAIDVDSGDVDRLQIDTDGDISGMAAFDEGHLLLVEDIWGEEMTTNLLLYDVDEEEVKTLGGMPTIGYNSPSALCFDEARGLLYYVLGGSVWRMGVTEDGLGEPEEFGDMPLEIYGDANAVLLDDLYILSSYDGVIGRDVTTEQLPPEHMVISNGNYIDPVRTAYFEFTAAHPEYMVSIQSGGLREDDVVQAMMSRDSGVDIYTVSSENALYGRLLSRGYMAELGESETLAAFVGELYPMLQELCSANGELFAVPMEIYSSVTELNTALLTEKFGYAEDELPTTWPALFELIADLSSGKMEDVPEASLYYPGWTQQDAKINLFYTMLGDYFLWLDADEGNLSRANEVLLALCVAFDKIDWAGLGLPEEYEEDGMWEYDEANMIFEQTGIQPYIYRGEEEGPQIWPLAIAEGEEAMISANVGLAFVNPFSVRREAAIEYLELALQGINNRTLTMLMPERNEPVESRYYKENHDSYLEMIADTEKRIAEAEAEEDDETVDSLQGSLSSLRDGLEWMEKYGRWEISPEGIERYRAYAGLMRPSRSNIWSSEDAYSQVQQYLDGAISAQQLVSELDKALTMQREEGM